MARLRNTQTDVRLALARVELADLITEYEAARAPFIPSRRIVSDEDSIPRFVAAMRALADAAQGFKLTIGDLIPRQEMK